LVLAGADSAFRNLVRLLSVHETAEEMLVHPEVRQQADGRPVVEDRLAEEHRAKVLLSTLGKMGPDAEGFDNLLVKLRDDVFAHAAQLEVGANQVGQTTEVLGVSLVQWEPANVRGRVGRVFRHGSARPVRGCYDFPVDHQLGAHHVQMNDPGHPSLPLLLADVQMHHLHGVHSLGLDRILRAPPVNGLVADTANGDRPVRLHGLCAPGLLAYTTTSALTR
jgi:hypothetical protein